MVPNSTDATCISIPQNNPFSIKINHRNVIHVETLIIVTNLEGTEKIL